MAGANCLPLALRARLRRGARGAGVDMAAVVCVKGLPAVSTFSRGDEEVCFVQLQSFVTNSVVLVSPVSVLPPSLCAQFRVGLRFFARCLASCLAIRAKRDVEASALGTQSHSVVRPCNNTPLVRLHREAPRAPHLCSHISHSFLPAVFCEDDHRETPSVQRALSRPNLT